MMIEKAQMIKIGREEICIIKLDVEKGLLLAIKVNGAINDKNFVIASIGLEQCNIIHEFYKIDNALEDFNAMLEGEE